MGDDVEWEVVARNEGEGESGDGEGGVVFLRRRRDGFDVNEVRGIVGGGIGEGVIAERVGGCGSERGRDALGAEEGGGGRVDVNGCGRLSSDVEDATLIESGGRPGRGRTSVGG
jgi:hypothetical protein